MKEFIVLTHKEPIFSAILESKNITPDLHNSKATKILLINVLIVNLVCISFSASYDILDLTSNSQAPLERMESHNSQ